MSGKKSKKSTKIQKRDITVDEVLIQSAILMVTTVSDTKRKGATVKFETEVNGEVYNVDVSIKRVEKPYMKKV